MSQPIHIQLLSSMCARNEYYMERVKNTAERLGLRFTLERITDQEIIYSKGIAINCFDYYCPGCHTMHADPGGAKCVPALFINDSLTFYNVPPDDAALEARLAEYLGVTT